MLISGFHSFTSPKFCLLHTDFYLIHENNIEVFNLISFAWRRERTASTKPLIYSFIILMILCQCFNLQFDDLSLNKLNVIFIFLS